MDKDSILTQTAIAPQEKPSLGLDWGAVQREALWKKIPKAIKNYFCAPRKRKTFPSDEELLQQAHEELINAQNLFSRVDEREMVDCAIYYMKAAEVRYDYLIKKIKQNRMVNC